jgi:hypothetical protein
MGPHREPCSRRSVAERLTRIENHIEAIMILMHAQVDAMNAQTDAMDAHAGALERIYGGSRPGRPPVPGHRARVATYAW